VAQDDNHSNGKLGNNITDELCSNRLVQHARSIDDAARYTFYEVLTSDEEVDTFDIIFQSRNDSKG